MSHFTISKYRVMWIFCFFDLPTSTDLEKKKASCFRKSLIKNGFKMRQFSVYIRYCSSWENACVHISRIKIIIPPRGDVSILRVTDKQYGDIINFTNYHQRQEIDKPIQLTLF